MKARFAGKHGFRRMLGGMALLSAMWLLATCLPAQSPKFYPSPLTGGLEPVLDLQGAWVDENRNIHMVPFDHNDRREMEVTKIFDLPTYENLQDTLYLYFEAIAWTSEIFLNDRLIAATDDPFSEQLFPIRKEWLRPTGDTLFVRLSTAGMSFPWYPKRFLGIFRQAALLQVAKLPTFPTFPKEVATTPKAVLMAPWGSKEAFVHDSIVMQVLATGLFSFPQRVPVAFPFRPSNQSLAMLARHGWTVLENPDFADSLAAYNAFPYSVEAEHKNLHFWRDERMRPTPSYGQFQGRASINSPEAIKPDTATLFGFLLIPVLCMALLKFASPKASSSLMEYLTKTKIYLELIADNKFLKVEQRWLMNTLRMFITATTVALLLYYVQLSETWEMLNILRNKSILYRALYGEHMALWSIFLWTLLIVIGLNLAKYFVINGIGTVFRVFSLGSSIQNLDVFAAFPLNLVPFAPATFIFFLEPVTGAIVLRVWLVLGLLYGMRRTYLMYSGLGRLYQISVSLKFLYICTLEILPWVILI